MGKKCQIVFIDNSDQVVSAQRDYFSMVLNNVKSKFDNQLSNLVITNNNGQLQISIDGYDLTMLYENVILNATIDTKEINKKVKAVLDNANEDVDTLFVVDLCLEEYSNEDKKTGIRFASALKSKITKTNKDQTMRVAACSGVPQYDRVFKEKGFEVFHRSLVPGDKFSNLETVFEESRYKLKLSELNPVPKDKEQLFFLLKTLIENPYQNTQYLGDILMTAYLLCTGE